MPAVVLNLSRTSTFQGMSISLPRPLSKWFESSKLVSLFYDGAIARQTLIIRSIFFGRLRYSWSPQHLSYFYYRRCSRKCKKHHTEFLVENPRCFLRVHWGYSTCVFGNSRSMEQFPPSSIKSAETQPYSKSGLSMGIRYQASSSLTPNAS